MREYFILNNSILTPDFHPDSTPKIKILNSANFNSIMAPKSTYFYLEDNECMYKCMEEHKNNEFTSADQMVELLIESLRSNRKALGAAYETDAFTPERVHQKLRDLAGKNCFPRTSVLKLIRDGPKCRKLRKPRGQVSHRLSPSQKNDLYGLKSHSDSDSTSVS